MQKNTLFMLGIAALLLAACNQQIPEANYDVIPQPKEVQRNDEKPFTLHANTVVYYEEGLQREAEFLSEYVNEILGYPLQTAAYNGQDRGIVLMTSPEEFDKAEAYEIDVTPQRVTIKGADAAGVFYGIQTLRKSLPIAPPDTKLQAFLPCGTIRDWPEFSYRGMHLDPCRHFMDLDSIKIYIDMLALHNMNQFHLHLTEDQGWRIEIKKYPELTQIGAWRDGTVIGHNSNLYDTVRHGGFYTQEELRDLVQYAAERHINIIPEIDLPGHMQAALATYPQLGCTGGPYEVWRRWGVSEDVLCAGNEEAMTFLEDVLAEVMDIFPSEIIHIGGDECPKTRWHECPNCQRKIKELGIKADDRFTAEDYLQSYVMERMERFIEARGRRIIGWDEILEGQVADNAIVMSWRGTEGGIEAARKGHDVVMAPTSYCYFDYYQSEDIANEPMGIGGYVPVEKVYSFDPLDELNEEEQRHIIGVQANIWTEYIASFSHVMYMALPRAAALAEVQWCSPEQRDYDDFLQRVGRLVELYDLLGYRYAKHIFNPAPLEDTVAPNLATFHPIILKSEPVKRYSGNGKGAPVLVDGVLGKGSYGSGKWLGFCGMPCDATIDLGATATLNGVRFRANVNKGAWIYNPKSAHVLVSDDGIHFTEAALGEYPISRWEDKDGIFTYELHLNEAQARYVEIVVEGFDLPEDHEGYGNPAWIFIDEIEVF